MDSKSDAKRKSPTSVADAVASNSDSGSILNTPRKATGAGALPPGRLPEPPQQSSSVYYIYREGFIRRQLKVPDSDGQRILYIASTNSIFSRKPKIQIHTASNPFINSSSQTLIASAALHIFGEGIDLSLETVIGRNGRPHQVKIICPRHDPRSFGFLSSAGFMRWQQNSYGSNFQLLSDGSGIVVAEFWHNAKCPSTKCGRLVAMENGRLLDEIVMSCLVIVEQERRRLSPPGMLARWRLG